MSTRLSHLVWEANRAIRMALIAHKICQESAQLNLNMYKVVYSRWARWQKEADTRVTDILEWTN